MEESQHNNNMAFSQRMGFKPLKSILQKDSIDNDLRNSLWNVLIVNYWNPSDDMCGGYIIGHPYVQEFIRNIWGSYFKITIDKIPSRWDQTIAIIRDYYFKAPWYEIYDFIEFVVHSYPFGDQNLSMRIFNDALEKELSAYRFIGKTISPITSSQEIEAIENAIKVPDVLKSVYEHISTAIKLLSNRTSPDFRNSIKESISAVESLCVILCGDPKASLSDALKLIEAKIGMHGALRKSFESLYGYTSDANGIRHGLGLLEESNLDFDDAKFMLVSCSAFVNFLVAKASKAGLKF
jgi:hypothetical protein